MVEAPAPQTFAIQAADGPSEQMAPADKMDHDKSGFLRGRPEQATVLRAGVLWQLKTDGTREDNHRRMHLRFVT